MLGPLLAERDERLVAGQDVDGKVFILRFDADGNLLVSSSGGGGGGAVTIADGADVTQGAIADVSVPPGNAGTQSAKLRGLGALWSLVFDSLNNWLKVSIQNATLAVTQSGSWVIAAGSALIGHVITDTGSTTAVTGNVATTVADGANVVEGATTGAAIITDADGTIQRYLRGLVKLAITAGGWLATVQGTVAHDAADAGNPLSMGSTAISFGANPTGVASGDRTKNYATVAGTPFVLPGHPNIITLRTNYTGAQTNAAIITVSGGTKIVVMACTVAADHANTVDVSVLIGFAAATTPTGAGAYLSHPGIAPGSGIREAGAVAGADGEDLRITSEVPTGGSIDVVTKYFLIES